jgi:hypothetical protein
LAKLELKFNFCTSSDRPQAAARWLLLLLLFCTEHELKFDPTY